jgi:hypothetical protein
MSSKICAVIDNLCDDKKCKKSGENVGILYKKTLIIVKLLSVKSIKGNQNTMKKK